MWSGDGSRALGVARRVRTGTIAINGCYAPFPLVPFGGFKESGWGRENGPHAIDAFTEVKHVYVNLAERSVDWFGDEG